MEKGQEPTAEDFDALADEKELSKRRAAAEDKFKDLGGDDLTFMRKWAKKDLFFLTNTMLEFDLLSPKLHKHYCKWKERTRGKQYRIELLPRGHYKTTINNGESIQIALPNDGAVTEYP